MSGTRPAVVECTTFCRILPTGASRPLLVRSRDGTLWVGKAHGNPQGVKALFNEIVAGRLANLMGLSWPPVSILKLSDAVIESVHNSGLATASPWASGTLFLDNLTAVPWPEGGLNPADTFPQRNSSHIDRLFPGAQAKSPLYGKLIFDNWVLLEDTKYETLHIDGAGRPVFLDASCAFIGLDWDDMALTWDATRIDARSPYLQGLSFSSILLEPWIERIQAIARPALTAAVLDLPSSWSTPPEYSQCLLELLLRAPQRFIPLFRDWLEWKETVTQ